ncbi:AMP-binding protein [Phytoactinopolyspora halotolerans]|uniref:AMP-binding protein n=1 Tax=Phytoactinopolyspora halotolerans TaxID=1981512 RepID=A0A6L9S9X9_9ACTN|nr:AMP-binding protein [Phytoactinopolyspora halotolerans]NEE01491.1 AMP-binding protein [Phytoactinopolyspora halotolerans]
MDAHDSFRAARDLLFEHRDDHDAAVAAFTWPALDEFNWALDWFDRIAEARPEQTALWVVDESGADVTRTYAEMVRRSNRLAAFLHEHGVSRGDRVLVMLGNVPELWDVMLASIKLGAVIIPATTLLAGAELTDRLDRGGVAHVVTDPTHTAKFEALGGTYQRFVAGGEADGWVPIAAAEDASSSGMSSSFEPSGTTRATDPLFLYFTSGTTSRPKLVQHTHASYPAGHLSTMYWIGLRHGDVHLNVSSPGWAKHAWSNFFAPWNAEATTLVFNFARFDARALLDVLVRCGVTTFCAPPTVWRMLIQQDLASWDVSLREVVGAGEPLNPEVIEQVRRAWGLTIRDGYGQTETTAQVGNSPGLPVKPGSMGRPLPGYRVVLLDPDGNAADEGEIALDLDERPLALMDGYVDAESGTAEAGSGGFYRTGDVASRDADGYLTYVGRADDVFKASDYRISPFELESVLIEHDAVAEAAVVPSPDPVRLAVPKAYVVLSDGHPASAETAESILRFCRERLSPFKRIRRLEFNDLPKTISGKIRRVELRTTEQGRPPDDARRPDEYWEEDFPALVT